MLDFGVKASAVVLAVTANSRTRDNAVDDDLKKDSIMVTTFCVKKNGVGLIEAINSNQVQWCLAQWE